MVSHACRYVTLKVETGQWSAPAARLTLGHFWQTHPVLDHVRAKLLVERFKVPQSGDVKRMNALSFVS